MSLYVALLPFTTLISPIIPRITPNTMSNSPIISISQSMRPDLKIAPTSTRNIAVTIRLLPPSLFTDNSSIDVYYLTSTILCPGDGVKEGSNNGSVR
jgi:hypothetical protein